MKITEIRKIFKEAGIPASFSYLTSRDSLSDDDGNPMALLIEMSRDRKTIEINFRESTDIKILVNKKKRQLVLNAHEEQHDLVGWDSVSSNDGSVPSLPKVFHEYEMRMGDPDDDGRYIALPEGTIYTVGEEIIVTDPEVIKSWRNFNYGNSPENPVRFYRVTASVPTVDHSFLMGFDDLEPDSDHPFVSMLPRPAKSVDDAHEILKPLGLPENATRVAEFFFAEANTATANKLDEVFGTIFMSGKYHSTPEYHYSDDAALGESENHIADHIIRHKDTQYVIGWVTDTEYRHAPVFFANWYRVYPNAEVPSSSAAWD
jgi:hypothetical protein